MNPVRQTFQNLRFAQLREHPMSHDSISVAVLAAAVVLDVVMMVLLVARVHHVNYPVPTHFTSLVGFDQVGSWYETYRIGLFSVFVTITNTLLAAKSFQRNRLVSFFLLLGSVAVALLCMAIGQAFAVIV